jgi:hypothetical protein
MDKVKDIVLSLLTWIGESPFRLFAVILLCVLGFVGWFIYSEKDAYMDSYRAQQALPHMNGRYEEAANFVLQNSKADLVAIFDVNSLLNTRKLVYFVTREGGQDRSLYGTNVGLLTKNYDNNADVISLMSGKVPCGDYERPQSYIGFTYKNKGINYMCRISVPAEPGAFIGQISVGWTKPPSDVEQERTVMTVASSLLFNKR